MSADNTDGAAPTLSEQAAELVTSVVSHRAASDRAINSCVAFAETFAEFVAQDVTLPGAFGVELVRGNWILTTAAGQIEMTRGKLTVEHATGLATHIEDGWLLNVARQLADAARAGEHAADVLATVAVEFAEGLARAESGRGAS
jgi:hypothetical protein